jgi:hypothetical protein
MLNVKASIISESSNAEFVSRCIVVWRSGRDGAPSGGLPMLYDLMTHCLDHRDEFEPKMRRGANRYLTVKEFSFRSQQLWYPSSYDFTLILSDGTLITKSHRIHFLGVIDWCGFLGVTSPNGTDVSPSAEIP